MIRIITTGVCDRCKDEVTENFHKITIHNEVIKTEQRAHTPSFSTGGISFYQAAEDARHLCKSCLKDFEGFMKND